MIIVPTKSLILAGLVGLAWLNGCDHEAPGSGKPPYTIRIYHVESDAYLQTRHHSEDLTALRELAESDLFANAKVQIVDSTGTVVVDPPVRRVPTTQSVDDIGKMLNVPVLGR